MLENLNDDQIRSACKGRIEALESWLRRLVHEELGKVSSNYENYTDQNENRLIKKRIRNDAVHRIQGSPSRYQRFIDALMLDDLIVTICAQWKYFSEALKLAFPEGENEAREFLNRLIAPRNKLAHANPISLREAERVVCYSGDVIDSLKEHYRKMGQETEYNAPTVVRFIDSLGNSFERSQMTPVGPAGVFVDLSSDPTIEIRPGEVLTLEVEIDPSFEQSEYSVRWMALGPILDGNCSSRKIEIPITTHFVSKQIDFRCSVTSNKDWHRYNGLDDMFDVRYRVLPPV